MMFQRLKCKLGRHDWFTETDRHQTPVFRICQCCGKYQQPIITDLHYQWHVIPPNTITASVLRQQVKLQNLITDTL